MLLYNFYFIQPDQPSNPRCREKLREILENYPLKGKKKKAEAKFKTFLAGGALPEGLKEGATPSSDEDDDDEQDKSSDKGKGRKKKSPTP